MIILQNKRDAFASLLLHYIDMQVTLSFALDAGDEAALELYGHRLHLLQEEEQMGLIGILIVAGGVQGKELIRGANLHAKVYLAALNLIVYPILYVLLILGFVPLIFRVPCIVVFQFFPYIGAALIHGPHFPASIYATDGYVPCAPLRGGKVRQYVRIQLCITLSVGAVGMASIYFLNMMQLMEQRLTYTGILRRNSKVL